MVSIFRKKIKVLVHDGRFHADEVFAVAVLKKLYALTGERVKVIRSREKENIENADIVLDVGGIYDHERKRYDHHQSEGAGVRKNGVPYAAFGLIWKHYGLQLCGSDEVVNLVDQTIVQTIDAVDISGELSRPKNENLKIYQVDNLIKIFNPIKGNKESSLKQFLKAVRFAEYVLEREIQKAKLKVNDSQVILDVYKNAEDKRILIFDEFRSLGNTLDTIPEPIYSITPSETTEKWSVYAIPVVSTNTFENRKKFPEEWCGLTDSELEKVSGVVGATFCHRAGFLCGAKTKEGAVELAKRALNF